MALEKIGILKQGIKMHVAPDGLFIQAAGVLNAIGIMRIRCHRLRLNQEFIGIADELLIKFIQFPALAFNGTQDAFLVIAQILRLQDIVRLTEFSLDKTLLRLLEAFGIDFDLAERPGQVKRLLPEFQQLPSFFLHYFAFIETAFRFFRRDTM